MTLTETEITVLRCCFNGDSIEHFGCLPNETPILVHKGILRIHRRIEGHALVACELTDKGQALKALLA